MLIENKSSESTLIKMRRDIVLIYVLYQLTSVCKEKNWSSLKKITLSDLNDAIIHLTTKQKNFIYKKIKLLFSPSESTENKMFILHYFALFVDKDKQEAPALQIQLLRSNFMDEFNQIKYLLDIFCRLISGSLKIIDEKNVQIYY